MLPNALVGNHRGAALRSARLAAGLSLVGVAREVGWFNASHLAEIERGERRPSDAVVERVLEAIAALSVARQADPAAPGGLRRRSRHSPKVSP